MLGDTFRSLSLHNYRLWAAGALVSNIGTWVQRTAQDWLVFTELTNHDASTVGVAMALQFGPQLVFLPWTGLAPRPSECDMQLNGEARVVLSSAVYAIHRTWWPELGPAQADRVLGRRQVRPA